MARVTGTSPSTTSALRMVATPTLEARAKSRAVHRNQRSSCTYLSIEIFFTWPPVRGIGEKSVVTWIREHSGNLLPAGLRREPEPMWYEWTGKLVTDVQSWVRHPMIGLDGGDAGRHGRTHLAVLRRTTYRGHPSALRAAGLSGARCGGFGEADAKLITIGELDAGRLESGS